MLIKPTPLHPLFKEQTAPLGAIKVRTTAKLPAVARDDIVDPLTGEVVPFLTPPVPQTTHLSIDVVQPQHAFDSDDQAARFVLDIALASSNTRQVPADVSSSALSLAILRGNLEIANSAKRGMGDAIIAHPSLLEKYFPECVAGASTELAGGIAYWGPGASESLAMLHIYTSPAVPENTVVCAYMCAGGNHNMDSATLLLRGANGSVHLYVNDDNTSENTTDRYFYLVQLVS